MLSSFSGCHSNLRLVIATSAFGLGIDCDDIQRIIHWGLPSTIEEYVPETGRAGRDGSDAVAIPYGGKVGRHSTEKKQEYISNTAVCRRRTLFHKFVEEDIAVCGCKCCDVCAKHVNVCYVLNKRQ